jgi:ribosome-associated protein
MYRTGMIKINNAVEIPEEEITITASRSSGPGGQNVNKVATKVTLRFSISNTTRLSDAQKDRIRKKLKNMINREDCVVMHDETGRSQSANRKRIIEKFAALMARALLVPKKRVPTKVSRSQKEKRLKEKKILSGKKTGRRKSADIE